jgi:hypothetical protein
MGQGVGIREVGFCDCAGGGQVVVENGIAYVGHMRAPNGTSLIDVRDPKNPKVLATIDMPPGTHSHKVRVANGLMVVNNETNHNDDRPAPDGWKGGFVVYDVSTPSRPREVGRWTANAGRGVHRFDFDGRYGYMSATQEGYVGNIVMIMDLKDPAKPTEVGRWWMPGQWTAGGETPTWEKSAHRCHHPLRMGNRLYTSYWLGGFVILDIDEMSQPKLVSGLDWSPPFACPTHTALPIPFDILGRRYLVVSDEDVFREEHEVAAFMWVIDITDERAPVPVASHQVEGIAGRNTPKNTGCHQPCEKVLGTEIPFAWFAQGLRVVDIKNPQAPREVAWYMPEPAPGQSRVSSNDITVDERGLLYLIDRVRGLSIVERT